MLQEFAAFLSLFSLLSLVVQLGGMARLFGLSALTLLAIDLLLRHFTKTAARVESAERMSRLRGNETSL